MMVLCPNHHHQATVNALTEEDQRRFKLNPFNIQRGFSDGQLIINSKIIAIDVGSNIFFGDGFKFAVDQEPILQIESDDEGKLLVSADLYDGNDSLLASIV